MVYMAEVAWLSHSESNVADRVRIMEVFWHGHDLKVDNSDRHMNCLPQTLIANHNSFNS